MKNAVFCDVAPCISCVNRHLGGTYRLLLQGRKIRERGTSVSRLSHQWKTPSCIRTGREGEWVTWKINREEGGRVYRDGRAGAESGPELA
jgi:hypothetical protein